MSIFWQLVLATAACACRITAASDGITFILIGNDNYAATPLRNAVDDARDLGGALEVLGFKVVVRASRVHDLQSPGARDAAAPPPALATYFQLSRPADSAPAAVRPAAVPDGKFGALPPPASGPPDSQPGREISPGVREISFADGAIYRGAMRGSNLHGKGEYISKEFRYQGEFVDGLKQGEGIFVWENGDRYEGRFASDRPEGRGKYRFANGDTYEGEVRGGVIAGHGTYAARNGDVFEGSFVDGRPHGAGVYRFASGDRYEGEMSNGAPHGKGRYVTQGGDRVEAVFAGGKPQGRGTYHFANGDRYEGDLAGGDLTGTGTYYYGTGLRYEGEMRSGQPQGRGTFWFLDGTRFEGIFEGGLTRARGEIVNRDGSRVPAEIVDGSARLLD